MVRRAELAVGRRRGRIIVSFAQDEPFLSVVPDEELFGIFDMRMKNVADSSFLLAFLHFGEWTLAGWFGGLLDVCLGNRDCGRISSVRFQKLRRFE